MTYRDYTEGDSPPRAFTITDETTGFVVEARLVAQPPGYWDRIAYRQDGSTYTSTISDASCLAMLLDALQRRLRVVVVIE